MHAAIDHLYCACYAELIGVDGEGVRTRRFDDGGWKLSAHSTNSWMSKIFLAQFVAEKILGLPTDPRADQAHADWWRLGCPSNPGIDQIFSGTTPERNFFYPRAITSYLWLP